MLRDTATHSQIRHRSVHTILYLRQVEDEQDFFKEGFKDFDCRAEKKLSMVSCQKDECGKMRILRRAVQSFLTALQSVIITSLWSYLKLQNATQHEKHAVFDDTIHFPKFSLILLLQFIRPLGIGIYALLSSTTYKQSIKWRWCDMPLMCHIYLILVHTPDYTSRYTLFVSFFSFWRIWLIRSSHLNTF